MPSYKADDKQQENWYDPSAPYAITTFASGVSSGTFQSTKDDEGTVYEITSNRAIFWLRGTGASVAVTTTTGYPLWANNYERFVPKGGMESIGWVTADGTNLAATDWVKVRKVGFTY